MKPMIKYRGGKSKELPRLLPHVPKFRGRYIEPFFGGGAMYFHLCHKNAVINDINQRLIGFYTAVRDNYPELMAELNDIGASYTANRLDFEQRKALHPNERVPDANEELYYRLRDMYNGITKSTYSQAALYYFINKTAYSGMIRFNAKGEFNVPYGRYRHFNIGLITPYHSQLLSTIEILNVDYSRIFEQASSDNFIFLDPPYDCVFSDYGNNEYKEGFGEEEHRRLAEDFRNLRCKALMVIGGTPFIRGLYKGLIVDEYDKSYAVNIRNRFQAEAKHIIITNYGNINTTRMYTDECFAKGYSETECFSRITEKASNWLTL